MNHRPKQVIVAGGFDDLRSVDLRFLEEAAKLGEVTVLLRTDELLRRLTGLAPKFSLAERLYLLSAVRSVKNVIPTDATAESDELPGALGVQPDVWADREAEAGPARAKICRDRNLVYHVFRARELQGFPEPPPTPPMPGRKKVVVTGCFDWFHSGQVRFFEEVSAYGDLYVVVGHDANIRLLKGGDHPLLPQDERRYMVGSVRYVKQALISSGNGWLDADPEIQKLKPDIYVVNEEGDKGGKREYCRENGIEYLVLRRVPAPGLPNRSSTDLRGF
jgi:cytidyltransferase-like protein